MSELLEKILSDANMKQAQKRVYANKGASGVDGVTVQELEEYLKENWTNIKQRDTRKNVQTTACAKSRNTKAKWWKAKTRHPNSC